MFGLNNLLGKHAFKKDILSLQNQSKVEHELKEILKNLILNVGCDYQLNRTELDELDDIVNNIKFSDLEIISNLPLNGFILPNYLSVVSTLGKGKYICNNNLYQFECKVLDVAKYLDEFNKYDWLNLPDNIYLLVSTVKYNVKKFDWLPFLGRKQGIIYCNNGDLDYVFLLDDDVDEVQTYLSRIKLLNEQCALAGVFY